MPKSVRLLAVFTHEVMAKGHAEVETHTDLAVVFFFREI
jgi:hypothetical protein